MPSEESGLTEAPHPGSSEPIVISVDAMGGDRGPAVVIDGVALAAAQHPAVHFVVHGQGSTLGDLLKARPELAGRCTLRDVDGVVTMDDKPGQVMRNNATSMWSAIESVRSREAQAVVSCGNTGALMALSVLRLRKLPGVTRPAIACLWPSANPGGFNIMLDVGADIKAEAADLLQYALMGASYARNGLGVARPRIGLLNVGTEEHKGRAELKAAQELITKATEIGRFDYVGFVEGSDLPSQRVDVIVTDGFTGNIALKTGEGTARLATGLMREALTSSLLARLGALLALRALKRMQSRIDPRLANGGVFLGLNGTVIKSHGSADATGVKSAINVAIRLAESGFHERLAARVASMAQAMQDAAQASVENGIPS